MQQLSYCLRTAGSCSVHACYDLCMDKRHFHIFDSSPEATWQLAAVSGECTFQHFEPCERRPWMMSTLASHAGHSTQSDQHHKPASVLVLEVYDVCYYHQHATHTADCCMQAWQHNTTGHSTVQRFEPRAHICCSHSWSIVTRPSLSEVQC